MTKDIPPREVGLGLRPLYHADKKGNLRIWNVWADGDCICTEYGIVDGKMQTASKQAEPKNVGTKAETSPEEQAVKEAAAMHKHRLDRKYSLTPEKARMPSELPMLAHKYEDKKKKVQWPASLQPKLDGLRCMARYEDGEVTLYSRSGKVLNLPHICEELASWMDEEVVLDGELYVHGVALQTINSWIPKPGQSLKEESVQIEYHVYDIPINDKPWSYRKEFLNGYDIKFDHIKIVDTWEVENEDEALEMVEIFLADGYEGGILRNHHGLYEWGKRSSNLLKMKKFIDEEFKIVGYYDGKGKDKGKVVWVCENNDGSGDTFHCRPRGTMKERGEWFKNAESFMGRLLTVRFQYRTEKNIPFLPVGIVFRIEEDLPR